MTPGRPIESFGRSDTSAADAEMLALGLEAIGHYGLSKPDIRMGDVALFSALVTALDLAPAWKRRLIKDFNHKSSLAHDLDRLSISPSHARPEYQGVLAALAGSDPKAAHALVTDLLSIAGITAVGGRSVGEIADRSSRPRSARRPRCRRRRALIEKFLAISGDPDEAAAELRAFARCLCATCQGRARCRVDLFESRTAPPRAASTLPHPVLHCLRSRLDYYTGLRAARPGCGCGPAGRRRPLRRVAHAARHSKSIPAVGFAVWIERLAHYRGRTSAPFVIAVPAKGRLQENAESFSRAPASSSSAARRARSSRRDRRSSTEVAYLSAAEIVELLAQGAVHFGLTGEDLVREDPDADREVVFIEPDWPRHRWWPSRKPGSTCSAWPIRRRRDRVPPRMSARCGSRPTREPHLQFLLRARGHRLPDRGKPGARSRFAAGTAELIADITTTGMTLAPTASR